jgi:hypothetical protein
MKFAFKLCTVALLFTAPLCAQEKPRALPKPKVIDRKFVAVMGLLAATKTADAITSAQMLNRGNYETNPLFGPRPSGARMAVVNTSYFAGEVLMAYSLKRLDGHKWSRALWLLEPSCQAADHARWAWHNSQLR